MMGQQARGGATEYFYSSGKRANKWVGFFMLSRKLHVRRG